VLDLILRELSEAYEAGYVHADMSEYNVAVSEEGITVFDWPQAVSTDHDNARELLERDVRNVVGFFRRKYPKSTPDVDVARVTDRIVAGEFATVRDD
jgi:RIO kinase 2